jgi:hypothetical protein
MMPMLPYPPAERGWGEVLVPAVVDEIKNGKH